LLLGLPSLLFLALLPLLLGPFLLPALLLLLSLLFLSMSPLLFLLFAASLRFLASLLFLVAPAPPFLKPALKGGQYPQHRPEFRIPMVQVLLDALLQHVGQLRGDASPLTAFGLRGAEQGETARPAERVHVGVRTRLDPGQSAHLLRRGVQDRPSSAL